MKWLQITVNVPINEDALQEEGHTIGELVEDIYVVSDDVVDGVTITRRGNLGDITNNFFIDSVNASHVAISVMDGSYTTFENTTRQDIDMVLEEEGIELTKEEMDEVTRIVMGKYDHSDYNEYISYLVNSKVKDREV